jgi:hypothetical protein
MLKLNRIKSSTAAGSNGINKPHLRQRGAVAMLTNIMNAFLIKNYYPQMWRENRTTLIPKARKDASDIRNWQPITIGSLLARIYSGILDKRLRRFVSFTDKQTGFTNQDGYMANISLLGKALSCMKADSVGVITVVDTAKAFDTISYAAFKKCLLRKGVSERIASYLRLMQLLHHYYYVEQGQHQDPAEARRQTRRPAFYSAVQADVGPYHRTNQQWYHRNKYGRTKYIDTSFCGRHNTH